MFLASTVVMIPGYLLLQPPRDLLELPGGVLPGGGGPRHVQAGGDQLGGQGHHRGDRQHGLRHLLHDGEHRRLPGPHRGRRGARLGLELRLLRLGGLDPGHGHRRADLLQGAAPRRGGRAATVPQGGVRRHRGRGRQRPLLPVRLGHPGAAGDGLEVAGARAVPACRRRLAGPQPADRHPPARPLRRRLRSVDPAAHEGRRGTLPGLPAAHVVLLDQLQPDLHDPARIHPRLHRHQRPDPQPHARRRLDHRRGASAWAWTPASGRVACWSTARSSPST